MTLNDQVPDGSHDPGTYLVFMTEYEIKIANVRKGVYENETNSIFGFGGQVGDEFERWSFGYNFTVGDNVLLFLTKSKANDVWMAVEQSKGVFLLAGSDEYWQVSSVTSDHMIVEDGSDHREFQKNTIKTLERCINEGEM